jgi:hypothetical protein
MNQIFQLIFSVLLIVTPAFAQPAQHADGPFGFYYGETRQQVIEAVGKAAVKESYAESMRVMTAPKPYRGIEAYTLFFSPSEGLLKILAVGDTIDTTRDGEQLQDLYHTTEAALESVYGAPVRSFDYLKATSDWTEAKYWMMGLLKQERVLDAFWTTKGAALPKHLTLIRINSVGLSQGSGYITISYEFEGWNEFVEHRDAKQNGVL